MAVARASSAESIRTGTQDPYSFTFTPAGTPRGIAVGIVHGVSSTDHVVGVTYGGVALARSVRATDTATESGAAELWFLGASVPTGAQTVSLDLASGTTDDLHIVVWELSGNADLEVIDFDSISQNAANPTVTLNKSGRTAISLCAMYGGGAAPGGTLATGNTLDHTHDLGAFHSQSCYETTVDSDDHTIGWSSKSSDDLAFVAIAVAEAGTTHTGASSLTLIAALTSLGTRTALGSSALSLAAGLASQGQRTAIGSSALVAALGVTSTALVTRFGASTLTLTVDIASQGARLVTGASALTLALSVTSAGTRQLLGQSSLTVTTGVTSSALRTAVGASELGMAAAFTSAGQRTALAASSVVLTLDVYSKCYFKKQSCNKALRGPREELRWVS